MTISQKIKKMNIVFIIPRNMCFEYLLESPQWGDSNKYPKHMFNEELREKKQGLFSPCILLI